MIYGIGHDLVEIDRVRRLLDKPVGEPFLLRLLTPAERLLLQGNEKRRAEFVAGRFAAKEAVSKALGCGIGQAVGFQDIEVLRDPLGKPVCTLKEEAIIDRLALNFRPIIHVSITHERLMASAYVVIERE